jgi:hypothetical protein
VVRLPVEDVEPTTTETEVAMVVLPNGGVVLTMAEPDPPVPAREVAVVTVVGVIGGGMTPEMDVSVSVPVDRIEVLREPPPGTETEVVTVVESEVEVAREVSEAVLTLPAVAVPVGGKLKSVWTPVERMVVLKSAATKDEERRPTRAVVATAALTILTKSACEIDRVCKIDVMTQNSSELTKAKVQTKSWQCREREFRILNGCWVA